MPGAAYDPTKPLLVQIKASSPHTFAYKLWIALPGAADWSELAQGDDTTPTTVHSEQFPVTTHIAYTLLVGGNPNTNWRVQVTLSQDGTTLGCSPYPESGLTSDQGVARRDTALQLA